MEGLIPLFDRINWIYGIYLKQFFLSWMCNIGIIGFMVWYEFEHGSSIGKEGSEEGIIIFDEEHSEGARLTVEEDGRIASFSITCGIYDLMVHTAFFSSLQEANNAAAQMKLDIENLMKLDGDELYNSLSDFTEKY